MKLFFTVVAMTSVVAIGFAQTPTPRPLPSQVPTGSVTVAFEAITVVGCIQLEADYRRGQAPGRAGSGGVEAKATDQFVLTDTSIVGAAVPTPGAPLASSRVEVAYQLSGPSEAEAQEFLGRRVEISGRANHAESTHANPTPGAVAATPAVPSSQPRVETLPELEVLSLKASAGTCAAR